MSKFQISLVIALIGSLAVNAWQFRRQSQAHHHAIAADSTGTRDSQSKLLSRKTSANATLKPSATPAGFDGAQSDLASILAIADPMDRMQALVAHVKGLSSDQIGDRLSELSSRNGKTKDAETQLISHLLLTRWGQEDPEAAFASLGSLSAKRNGSQASAILAGLAATDPNRAVAWLTDPNNNAQHQPWIGHSLASALSEEWSRQNPEAAIAWAASLEPGGLQSGAYSGIINNLIESDPERAASFVMDIELKDRSELIGQIAETWATQTPEAAVNWASSLEGRDRHAAMSEAMAGWAQTAPESAASYVNGLLPEERADHVGVVARSWAEQAPAEAAQWLGSQPEGEGKANAMGHVMWNWTNNDPESASAWLAEQPPGESFDRGVTGLAKAATHAFDDPEAGVTWSSTIQNEDLRATMTQHTLGQWLQQDPTAAQAWATANGVEAPPSSNGGK